MILNSERITVKVGNGEVGVGSRVAWVRKYGGVRTGTIDLIAQRSTYPNTWKTKIRVKPDRKEADRYYQPPQTLYRLDRVIHLPTV